MQCAHLPGSPNVRGAVESERSMGGPKRARARIAPCSFGGWVGARYGTAPVLEGDGRSPYVGAGRLGPAQHGGQWSLSLPTREEFGSKKHLFCGIGWLTVAAEGGTG